MCAFAQKVSINGKEGYRQLSWEDFKGKVDKASPFTAVTHWFLSWNEGKPAKDAHGKPVLQPEVEVSFMGDSWVNKKRDLSPELLRHEQGHFDIALVCAAELAKQVKAASFTAKNFEPLMNKLFDAAYDKCARLQEQYDAETGHGCEEHDADQQRWNSFLAQQLSNSPAVALNTL
ncbi:DUF922 domain-containing protein [Polluticoccus soli]|uniref:DUF922 domain-containing protein n=1 Tax=Polluticoccus soli TaxID=3034150 RepID=UPI0023E0BF9C|nr:DUF922 domain-containing protein [Flavipsychrobacter sp. JY13-12]